MTFAFDIDGTLLTHPDDLDPVSLLKAKPITAACARVRSMIQDGVSVHFITGRAHAVRQTTLQQLRVFIHPSISDGDLTTQKEFLGYEAMIAYKAKALIHVGANSYVGDHDADRQAAQLAGLPFLHAHEFNAWEVWV